MTNTQEQIIFLLKFGSHDDIMDLYENGTVYFNSIDYFQNLEEQGLRGDNYEGTFQIRNFTEEDKITLKIKDPKSGKSFKLYSNNTHLREFYKDVKGNIYCMYSLRLSALIDTERITINNRVKDFGSHFVIINNTKRFLDKVCIELKKKGISYKIGLVNYYDRKKINCELGTFDKPTEFEYQKEYRIVLYRDSLKPIKVSIGSIKDIAGVFETSVLDNIKVEISHNNGGEGIQ